MNLQQLVYTMPIPLCDIEEQTKRDWRSENEVNNIPQYSDGNINQYLSQNINCIQLTDQLV